MELGYGGRELLLKEIVGSPLDAEDPVLNGTLEAAVCDDVELDKVGNVVYDTIDEGTPVRIPELYIEDPVPVGIYELVVLRG